MKRKIYIEGMSCEHCIKRVENALHELKGVKNLKVGRGLAEAEFKEEVVDAVIINAIEEAGYDVLKIE